MHEEQIRAKRYGDKTLRVDIETLLEEIAALRAELAGPAGDSYIPPEGSRVVKIYRNGTWLVDDKYGQRTHVGFPDFTPPESHSS